MKLRSHLYRMNPQAIQRPSRTSKFTTALTVLFVSTLAVLYWIGKHYNP